MSTKNPPLLESGYTYEEQLEAVLHLAGVAGLKFAMAANSEEKAQLRALARALYDHALLLDHLNHTNFVEQQDLLGDDLVFTDDTLTSEEEEATKISVNGQDPAAESVKTLLMKNNADLMRVLDAKTVDGAPLEKDEGDTAKINQLIDIMIVHPGAKPWGAKEVVTNREYERQQAQKAKSGSLLSGFINAAKSTAKMFDPNRPLQNVEEKKSKLNDSKPDNTTKGDKTNKFGG